MGLLEPVALVAPQDLGPVHLIAAGGSGMNGIASMFLELGVPVSGSDRSDSAYLRGLAARGADVHVGHSAEQLGDAQTVVVSSAIREDNPELAEARRRGLRVGFTNGCFDLLHPGHVSLLRRAAEERDRLVVAINTDTSVQRLIGPSRPVQSEDARAYVLGG